MHPGGTNIIKSNGGVDCTKSFDLLAHTNNPEVSSLLTKYCIGELTPKPAFQSEDISMLYDLWKGYLRVATEQVVASNFEVGMITESSLVWFQGDLFNMGGVRRFYHYQSRLLEGGFSTLFGAKLQELYLKISFTLANVSSANTKLSDVLGVIARAKGSHDAVTACNEISQIGQFTCDSESARHHEKGIIAYAQRSVRYDMEFLEAIREEACTGMDAFDSIMELDISSHSERVTALSTFLMQVLEKMANRLEGFYAKLARHSVYQPEIERNPARARWNILKRKIWDGSFFILAREASIQPATRYPTNGIEFDRVMSQIEMNLSKSSPMTPRTMGLNEQHAARAMSAASSTPAYEQHTQSHALKAMSTFIDTNKKAIRRLSKLPQAIDLKQLMQTYGSLPQGNHGLQTPPLSRSPSSSSSTRYSVERQRSKTVNDTPQLLRRRNTAMSDSARSNSGASIYASPTAAMSALMTKMNTRTKSIPPPVERSPEYGDQNRTRSMQAFSQQKLDGIYGLIGSDDGAGSRMDSTHVRSQSTNGNLRAFRLQASTIAGGMNRRSDIERTWTSK